MDYTWIYPTSQEVVVWPRTLSPTLWRYSAIRGVRQMGLGAYLTSGDSLLPLAAPLSGMAGRDSSSPALPQLLALQMGALVAVLSRLACHSSSPRSKSSSSLHFFTIAVERTSPHFSHLTSLSLLSLSCLRTNPASLQPPLHSGHRARYGLHTSPQSKQ